MDCYHSGYGTRGDVDPSVLARRTLIDKQQRLIESDILSQTEFGEFTISRNLDGNSSGWLMLQGRHVLMATCGGCHKSRYILFPL
ncbi:MAG: hypothetical protein AAF215_05690 [Cyanobacteria bacterium P01_A01_bin.123]